jgi:hypothetical protein
MGFLPAGRAAISREREGGVDGLTTISLPFPSTCIFVHRAFSSKGISPANVEKGKSRDIRTGGEDAVEKALIMVVDDQPG